MGHVDCLLPANRLLCARAHESSSCKINEISHDDYASCYTVRSWYHTHYRLYSPLHGLCVCVCDHAKDKCVWKSMLHQIQEAVVSGRREREYNFMKRAGNVQRWLVTSVCLWLAYLVNRSFHVLHAGQIRFMRIQGEVIGMYVRSYVHDAAGWLKMKHTSILRLDL